MSYTMSGLRLQETVNKVFAFTLAEVLITLGIIGLIAEFTIPTLAHDIDEAKTKSELKVAYSILNQALTGATTDNGGTIAGYTSINYDNVALKNLFLNYLKVSKDCGGVTGANSSNKPQTNGCWFITKYLNGDPVDGSYFDTYTAGMVLANGMAVVFRAEHANCSDLDRCGWLVVDVNGGKKPNTIGKDAFYFEVYPDSIKPLGTVCHPDGSGNDCGYKYLYQ